MTKILDIHSHFKGGDCDAETIYSFTASNIPQHFMGYKSVGIHPWYIENTEISWDSLEKSIREEKTLAIGETGLDKNINTPLSIQEELFVKHVQLSETHQKPLIIHNVKSTPEIIRLHKEYSPKQTWIIHGFRGKPELYQEYQRVGILVSIGSKFNPKTVENIPLNELLLETDDSLDSIQTTIETISSIKKITPQQLIDQIYKNTSRIFFH